MPSNRVDPYRAYNFKLEIQGVTEGHFVECVGLGVNVEVIDYREAGQGEVVRRLPGRVDYTDVTLRYGLTQSTQLWDWFQGVVSGKVERKNVSVVMVDTDGATETMRWNLLDCWPAQWQGAALNALSREAAIESVTLTYETLERA
jgi:phage tail-like protein